MNTASDIEELLGQVDAIEHDQVFDYLSQWGFERMLDTLAVIVQKFLVDKYRKNIGCSLFYRPQEEPRYVIGGSSCERTRIDPAARWYFLNNEAHKHSFSAFSLRMAQPLAFDDFPAAVSRLRKQILHVAKDCELPAAKQLSFLTIPGPLDDFVAKGQAALQCAGGDLPNSTESVNECLPKGLLRVIFDEAGMASKVLSLFLNDAQSLLKRVFALVEQGRAAVRNQDSTAAALAIADLNSNLLRFHDSEYQGLDALASHLQTLFADCECSIFRAVPFGKTVRLYLAATTALSSNRQHKKFRDLFFKQRKHYVCDRDPQRREDPSKWHKTERAYYNPGEPVYEPNPKGRGGFPGRGEWKVSTSFLALAIPSRLPGGEPYGVVRLVRGNTHEMHSQRGTPFEENDRRLAAAIAKSLHFWLDLFPRNDNLEIEWASDSLKRDTLRALSALGDKSIAEGEIELNALLRKLFSKNDEIFVSRAFSGYSGAAVLLVESDNGPGVILKCATKFDKDPSLPISHKNAITDEMDNYLDHVQGRIRLNHSVIFPNHIRETRRLNGFVSTFVGSGLLERYTLTQFAESDVSVEHLFRSIMANVSNIVEEVCQSWYLRAKPRTSDSGAAFIEEAFWDEDLGWHVANNKVGELDNLVYDAARHLKVNLDKDEVPSAVWERFEELKDKMPAIRWAECVTHGDLHGGNIFVNRGSPDVWLIDFARTKKRTSVFDLATLEANIKFQLLPNLLRRRDVLYDEWEFIQTFQQIEQVLASQKNYEDLVLPTTHVRNNPQAVPMLRGAVRVVNQIRILLHDAIRRTGNMTDYRIVLLLQTFRYMNVHGASDADISNVGILLAAISSHAIVGAFEKELNHRK